MSLFLDSAIASDAREAAALGFFSGITTNPSLLAQTKRPALEVIPQLCDLLGGFVFYQLTSLTMADREAEARRMAALRPGRIGLKIPCTLENLTLARKLSSDSFLVGITAIFDPAQAYLACQAGARYILPYVNRSTRLLGDGVSLVREMRAVLDAGNTGTEIIAASIKTPAEAVQTVLAGAHHLTLPLDIASAMGDHPLSSKAIEAFRKAMIEYAPGVSP